MLNKKIIVSFLVTLVATCTTVYSQVETRKEVLKNASAIQARKEQELSEKLVKLSLEKNWPMVIKGKKGRFALLSGIDDGGYPMYIGLDNNTRSAATIGTNQLWAGGSTGLNLSGSSANMKGKLGLWDGAAVRATHVELAGRVLQKDNTSNVEDHSTHVAGTLMASGVNPIAKGMAYGLQQLIAYDLNNQFSEMINEAPNLLLSNHSYGYLAGWNFNEDQNRWEFWGEAGANEDYKFGYYSVETQIWDSIAYNAPNYLIVKSAGNNRESSGPAVGQPYYRFNASGSMVSAGNRPAGISNNDSYESLSTTSTAKNILVVGAVYPIASGYVRPQDVVMTTFSSWGPSDDGRIKPDVVTNGVDVVSSAAGSDNDYANFSGTSMSSPSAAGSLFLLQEQYSKMHGGAFLRSATLKGIAIHTADEAGNDPGPDYQNGWGLLNLVKAVSVITSNNTSQLIQENVLNNGATYSTNVVASGKGPLVVTISWTDPKGTVETISKLNNPAIKLVNDLDVRVKKGATTYMPWILNPAPALRSQAATKGDNIRDNVEKIEIPEAVPGEAYTIEVTHKGTLDRGSQAYSLIVSGVGGQAYCTSAPGANGGARIDSVSIGDLNKANPAGCTTYTNYTNLVANIEANSTIPIYVAVGSCDATATDKIVKAFIDINNDGDFNDAGELVAQSPVITGPGSFAGNAVIPAGIAVNNYSILRIVVQETNNAASVLPCGAYGKGETQDFRVHITLPSTDMTVAELASPDPAACSNDSQYVSLVIRNSGSAAKSGFPVSATVKSGATTIATLNANYPGTIAGYGEAIYTFQSPFKSDPGVTYTITSSVNLTGDQNPGNNQITSTSITASPAEAPSGQAEICGTSVLLKADPSPPDVLLWYDAAAATKPIATGINTSSTIITGDKTYYLGKNDLKTNLGPVNKMVFTDGGYNSFSYNFVNFSNTEPLIIESARLYIGNPGKITFIVGDISNYNPDSGSYSLSPISVAVINAYATDPTPLPGAQTGNNPLDTGNVFLLNLAVPTVGDHVIVIICEDGATIFRNNLIPGTNYPFSIPGLISITGNSATQTGDPNYFQKFYYFFYNMKIGLSGCPATTRVPVVATTAPTPSITLADVTFTSSIATGNQWYKDGIAVAGATAATYTATASGTYKTVVTDNFGCSLTSNALNVTVTAVPNIDPAEIGLKLHPNPNNGQFIIEFSVRTKADLGISLVNALGQEVFRRSYPGFVGKFNQQLAPSNLAPGIYMLKVFHDNKNYIRKIIVR